VAEAAVVGVPDPKWGERVVAAVVWADLAEASVDELDRLARQVLSQGKRPKEIRFVTDLPRNPNGKADRNRIRDLFL
jgi:acyl-CoA synthetase (AMP-forming)/AMP-acid ligase II